MNSLTQFEVMEDLRSRASKRRLRSWRRMVERYARLGLIQRVGVKCPSCGRMVPLLCDECLGRV